MSTRPYVQVISPPDEWILYRMAAALAERLPYARHVDRGTMVHTADMRIHYWVNYRGFEEPSRAIDGAWFTHEEDESFVQKALRVDFCVCHARQYYDQLRAAGVREIRWIQPGVDLERFAPRLRLAVVGKTSYPNKGKELLDQVRRLPHVEVVATEGRLPLEEIPNVIRSCDYVLIPSSVEGGPMSLPEALACGKEVIAPPDVGAVGEYDRGIIPYDNSDFASLAAVLDRIHAKRLALRAQVLDQTWDRFAQQHDELFTALVGSGRSR